MDLRLLRYFVAVAEELHFGRAANRLHMSQPPLSRAIRQLEADLGTTLLHRSAAGVSLTPAGATLLTEARNLLEQSEQVRARVNAAASLTVGILADSTDPGIARLADSYRRLHPTVTITIRDADLTDPTCGLRAGLVDIAITRAPFDPTGLHLHELRADPLGAVLRTDDPLATRDRLTLADLADRAWFQFPPGTDALWQSFWNGGQSREGPVVRAVQECIQAVLWNGTIGLAPLGHHLSEELVVVPVTDLPPSPVVAAWPATDTNPLIPAFVQLAATAYRG
ncbi:LysR substrate-binding domain-containing protein [Kribbella albertanoniae]|uniref:LysR family transcriptional regulator n=1 Tax=Kribbella albertanoniae TaxID=1266829 RepID=A0A4V6PA51_9ACTN|nr:LysR substrate-binding domain-containing protein [Kribbella albertanoniae]TDC17106.1 LysR family transcriptional regulator [Kribbella albertanoniae]